MNTNISIIAAYFAGVASFINPCVLAVVPIYISSTLGRKRILRKSVMFSLGFILFFVLLGVFAGLFTPLLKSRTFEIVQACVILLFGIAFLLIRYLEKYIVGFEVAIQRAIAPLQKALTKTSKKAEKNNFIFTALVAPFLTGIIAAVAWTPCIGPVLAAIFTLAINTQNTSSSVVLLTVYALGMLTPFIIFSLFWKKLAKKLGDLKQFFTYTYLLLGVVFSVYGLYLLITLLSDINYYA